jgi:hypothetical protein
VRCTATLLIGVVVVLTIGLANLAPKALAAAVDTPTLLPADQTTDDRNDRLLFLVPALTIAVLARGALLASPVPRATWLAGRAMFPRLARAPPTSW